MCLLGARLISKSGPQAKVLIICEVGLKLFPLLGDAIKWLSAGELRQIPRVNKSSRPAAAAV